MRVFLATPMPGAAGRQPHDRPDLLVDYANRMRAVAAQRRRDPRRYLQRDAARCARYIGVDGLHPNEAGYAKIADLFFQAIQTNLEVR